MCGFLAAILCTFCVQEGGFEGPESGPKQRRINNRLLSYRPQHRRGNVHNYLIVRWFSVFRNCAESALRYDTATSPVHLLCTISELEFRVSRRVQPTRRQDVLAQPGSAVFSRRSDQQTEPQCGSLEDKLLKRNELYSYGIELRTTPRSRPPEPITQNNARPAFSSTQNPVKSGRRSKVPAASLPECQPFGHRAIQGRLSVLIRPAR